jgi:hypothetical protein
MIQFLQASPLVYLWLAGLTLFGFATDPVAPATTPATNTSNAVAFDLGENALEEALRQFSAQSNCQVIVPSRAAHGVQTRAVKGTYTARRALERMLDGTPLMVAGEKETGPFALVERTAAKRDSAAKNAGALIVVGLATDEEQAQRLREQAEACRAAFARRGFAASRITVLPRAAQGNATREDILTHVRSMPSSLEESWLVLLGNAANARDGRPAFQIRGPRFSADDLKDAADALPGKTYVVVGTCRSGGFLPSLLTLSGVEAVAATSDQGEVNEPRFMALWTKAMNEDPEAAFDDLAARASAQVQAFYRTNHLGQTEHAYRIDWNSRRVVAVSSDVTSPPPSPHP